VTSQFQLFDRFAFRTPVLPITSLNTIDIKSDLFKEAIYIASRDLFRALSDDWENGFDANPLKLQLSLMKYFLRMSTRCTPFGIFAGCGTGLLTSEDIGQVKIKGKNHFKTVTRLDMDFVSILIKRITDDENFRKFLSYYPNNTLYQIGDHYRYIDYKTTSKKRKYTLSEIDTNEYVIKVLDFSRKGALLEHIIQRLADLGEYSNDDIALFVSDLIDSQILVSELYPGVTGNDALFNLQNFLNRTRSVKGSIQLESFISNILSKLSEIDSLPPGRPTNKYDEIEDDIKKVGIEYNPKYIFQSDMFIMDGTASIGNQIKNSLYDGLKVLNKLSYSQESADMKKFKEIFYKRYEDQEVLLSEVLDTDFGIGYGHLTPESAGKNPLLENIGLERKAGKRELTLNTIEYMLLQKYHDFLRLNLSEIELTDLDIIHFDENWNDLPTTMSSMVEILSNGKEGQAPLIYMHAVGGYASNLLTRFAHGSADILAVTEDIIKKEEEYLKPNQVIAEIVHLPEDRTGNILYRPSLRKYEIPYLALTGVDEAHSIPVSDIWVSVSSSKKLKLRSKLLNKEILPRLSSAHNFRNNALPIYQFLCVAQHENSRSSLSFNWGTVLSGEKFLPRVRYKNVILSPATWIIEEKDLVHLKDIESIEFRTGFAKYLKDEKISSQCYICYSDNKLYIDFTDDLSRQLFLTEVRKRKKIRIEEFLFDQKNLFIQDSEQNGYTNQFIFSFYKNNND
jgi:hypothetical protein